MAGIRRQAPGESEFSVDVPEEKIVRYDTSVTEALTRGELQTMVGYARENPRSMVQCIKDLREMATATPEIAARCHYAIPRGRGPDRKMIEGPSVRFAELVFSAFPHLHSDESFLEEQERFIIVRARVYDCQMNRGAARVVRRRITDGQRHRYNDDMIEVTVRAALSIAFRNAVLRVIPPAMWTAVLEEVMDGAGQRSGPEDMERALAWFKEQGGVEANAVFTVLGISGRDEFLPQHLRVLRGMATSLKEGNMRWSMFTKGMERPTSSEASAVVEPETLSPHAQRVDSVFGAIGGGA